MIPDSFTLRVCAVPKLWLDDCCLDGRFSERSISPLLNPWQWFLLSEYWCLLSFWGEELNLVSKVGTLNTKMQDHLLEIRDNPVGLQLLEASCVNWICCLFCGSSFFFLPSAPKHKEIQRECWSRNLATFLSEAPCTVSPFINLTPTWRQRCCLFCSISLCVFFPPLSTMKMPFQRSLQCVLFDSLQAVIQFSFQWSEMPAHMHKHTFTGSVYWRLMHLNVLLLALSMFLPSTCLFSIDLLQTHDVCDNLCNRWHNYR